MQMPRPRPPLLQRARAAVSSWKGSCWKSAPDRHRALSGACTERAPGAPRRRGHVFSEAEAERYSFHQDGWEAQPDDLALIVELRGAIERDEIELYYHPSAMYAPA